MNSFTTKLADAYTKLKYAEWNSMKHEAPEGLNYIGELTDDAFILYHLRVYIRLKFLPKMLINKNYTFSPEHFSILQQLMALRKDRIARTPILQAYCKMYEILEFPATDERSPRRLDDLLRFLRTHRDDIPSEDWVDLCSCISNYTTEAMNRGRTEYITISLASTLHQVEHKFGDGWTKKSIPMPSGIFGNIAKLVLRSEEDFTWNTLEIDRIPTTESPRTVYEWWNLFSKAYRSRLVESEKIFYVNFTNALMAFHKGDYKATDKSLAKIERREQEMLNLDVYAMRLMVLYGLATDPASRKGAYVRQFNTQVDGDIKKFDRVINHLATKKKKYPPFMIAHYRNWLTGFSALRSLYNDLVTRGKADGNAIARARLVYEKKKSLPQGFKEMVHQRKVWVEKEMDKLAIEEG